MVWPSGHSISNVGTFTSRSQHMDKTKALENLLNGTATEEEIELLKHGLASGEISIGGDVNYDSCSSSKSMYSLPTI
jgi:hypothetical protein